MDFDPSQPFDVIASGSDGGFDPSKPFDVIAAPQPKASVLPPTMASRPSTTAGGAPQAGGNWAATSEQLGESAIGLDPSKVPSGKGMMAPVRAAERGLVGLGQFITSPMGMAQSAAAAVPGIGLVQRAKFLYDLGAGATESGRNLYALAKKIGDDPAHVTDEDIQSVNDNIVGLASSMFMAGKMGEGEFTHATGMTPGEAVEKNVLPVQYASKKLAKTLDATSPAIKLPTTAPTTGPSTPLQPSDAPNPVQTPPPLPEAAKTQANNSETPNSSGGPTIPVEAPPSEKLPIISDNPTPKNEPPQPIAQEVPPVAGTPLPKEAETVPPQAAEGENLGTGIGQGPGAKTASGLPPRNEPAETLEEGTGLKNAIADLERVTMGLPDATATDRQDMGAAWDRALKSNPLESKRIADAIVANPKRGLTADESALLLKHKVDLGNALNDAASRTFTEKTPEGKQEAESDYARLKDEYESLLDAIKERGSEWGREGRWRQALADEDYTFATRSRRLQAAKGDVLDTAERDKLIEQTAKLKQEQEAQASAAKEAEANERIAAVQAELDAAKKELASQPKFSNRVLQFAQKAVDNLDKKADASREALKNIGITFGSGPTLDLKVVGHLANIVASHIAHVGLDTAKLTKAMVDEFGEKIKPYLQDLFKRGQAIHDAEFEPAGDSKPAAKKAVRKKMDAKQNGDIFKDRIKDKIAAGKKSEITNDVQKLFRSLVEGGEHDLQKLIDQVHEFLKEGDPEITRLEAMDAISGRGKFTLPSQDALSKEVRDLTTQTRLLGHQEDVIAGKPLPRTGPQRDKLSDTARRLQQTLNDLKRKFGVVVRDPAAQLASALDARKTYYRNRMADLSQEIATRERTVKNKSPSPTDPELESMRAEYAKIKSEHDSIFGQKGMTDEQKLRMALAAVERESKEYERRVAAKEFTGRTKGQPIKETPELKAARARRDALKEQFNELRDLDQEFQRQEREKQVMRQKAALEKSIAEKEAKLASGDLAPQGRPVNRPGDPELEELLQKRDELNRQLDELRHPKKSPVEMAMQAAKTRDKNRIAELEERIKSGDFSPRPKRPTPPMDKERQASAVRIARLKDEIDRGERSWELKNRTAGRKFLDRAQWLRREMVLSSPASVFKLTTAALQGLAFEPVKEAVGAGIAKALPGFASRLGIEAPSSVKIEAKAAADAFTDFIKDWKKIAKTGKSDRESVYGSRIAVPEEMKSYFGRMHAMLKNPLKRAAFTRAFEKLKAQEIAKGNNPHDLFVDMRIGTQALKEANRQLFLEDNRLVTAYQSLLSAFERKDPATGKPHALGSAGAAALRWTIPIVRIPTNLIARTIQSSVGFPVGAAKLAHAYAKGIQELPQEQADLIMRQLKAGSIGSAFLLYGFFNPTQFGAFYQEGEKRKPGELKPGTAKIGGLAIAAWALERPELLAAQLGAAIHQVADSKIRKKDTENAGLGEGALAGLIGLTDQVPFVKDTLDLGRLFNKYERGGYVGRQVNSMVNPQLEQWLAAHCDKDANGNPIQRDPKGIIQNVEMGIPRLRENVPVKVEKTSRATDKPLKLHSAR